MWWDLMFVCNFFTLDAPEIRFKRCFLNGDE